MRAISSFLNRARARHNFRPTDESTSFSSFLSVRLSFSTLYFLCPSSPFAHSLPPCDSPGTDSVEHKRRARVARRPTATIALPDELSGVLTPRAIRHCHHRIFTGVYPRRRGRRSGHDDDDHDGSSSSSDNGDGTTSARLPGERDGRRRTWRRDRVASRRRCADARGINSERRATERRRTEPAGSIYYHHTTAATSTRSINRHRALSLFLSLYLVFYSPTSLLPPASSHPTTSIGQLLAGIANVPRVAHCVSLSHIHSLSVSLSRYSSRLSRDSVLCRDTS